MLQVLREALNTHAPLPFETVDVLEVCIYAEFDKTNPREAALAAYVLECIHTDVITHFKHANGWALETGTVVDHRGIYKFVPALLHHLAS
jgi:hypothetical protein